MEELKEYGRFLTLLLTHKDVFFTRGGLRLNAPMLYMQRLCCFDLSVSCVVVTLRPGMLHAEEELEVLAKLALQNE